MQQSLHLPDIECLTAFVAAPEAGSFNAAGQRLHRDANRCIPAGRAIHSRLSLAWRLLERSTRRSGTYGGRGGLSLHRVRPLLQELIAAGQETERFSDGEPRGRLRLAFTWQLWPNVKLMSLHYRVSRDVCRRCRSTLSQIASWILSVKTSISQFVWAFCRTRGW